MAEQRKINNALISVYHKDGLESIVRKLKELDVTIYSTGGTYDFIRSLGVEAEKVEDVTSYPSILGGRVKTLHPKVFGGILARREHDTDPAQVKEYEIPLLDLVIVDLYPFEDTVASTTNRADIIEKIDIGGISLIRAAAKNYQDVIIIPDASKYDHLNCLLEEQKGYSSLEDRLFLATHAFSVSSHYDTAIFNYFNKDVQQKTFKQSFNTAQSLRYGENPHQEGVFYGDFNALFNQLHGKKISYNNLLDIDAATSLIKEFDDCTFAILKHNNACGVAVRENICDAWEDALAGDPISAFGGVLITNREVSAAAAEEINKLFFEIIIAPSYDEEALSILKSKKNRIILQQKSDNLPATQFRTILNGVLEQDKDLKRESAVDMVQATKKAASNKEISDLVFANILVKHTKSNAIVLAKNGQLIASGTGQTSRVDALQQAIVKAKSFEFSLSGAIMASDAFFPFPDCVEIAHKEGITAVIQPGGSINDKTSIEFCDKNDMAMVTTGTRHFKH